MKTNKLKLIKLSRKKQGGYTLLEYCAGAAIIAGIIFAALTLLKDHMQTLLDGVGTWVGRRSTEMKTDVPFTPKNPTP